MDTNHVTRFPPLYFAGMPSSGSWQDLKDHMREAGDVCYADVFKDGTGVVEFGSKDDAEFAVKHLDDSKFRSHEVSEHLISALRLFPFLGGFMGKLNRALRLQEFP